MEENNQVVIVGGGLAGLTAAIHLSKCGFQVSVIDKNEYPRHKVCGEYISNEILPYLDWLGLEYSDLNPTQITQLQFSTSSGKIITADLPLGGFGLSRYELDYLLYKKAVAQNCTILHQTVTNIDFSEDRFNVTLSNNDTLYSKIVIGAYGKRSNIDQKLHRSFIQKKSPWLAVKAHYKGDFSETLVGLHNFKGGYCGVSKVEGDTLNICYLADFKTFKKYKNIEEYQEKVLYKNPILKTIFENATAVYDKPLTISQISFDKKDCIDNHILMIGDTAGLIHPLCGNGMAIAIHSAKIACELISGYLNRDIPSRQVLEQNYRKNWNQNFAARLQTGRFLGKLLQQQKLSEILIRTLVWFPALLPKIIKRTHGQLVTIEQ